MQEYRKCKGGANTGADEGYRAGWSSLRTDCTTAMTTVSIETIPYLEKEGTVGVRQVHKRNRIHLNFFYRVYPCENFVYKK